MVFKNAKAARRALSNGRINVLGRWSYLVEDKRPSDPKGDAFRFLAALGDENNLSRHSRSRVLKVADNAGTPRSDKKIYEESFEPTIVITNSLVSTALLTGGSRNASSGQRIAVPWIHPMPSAPSTLSVEWFPMRRRGGDARPPDERCCRCYILRSCDGLLLQPLP